MPACDIVERIYPAGTPSDVATVQKLISRLEAKKLVARERVTPVHLFRATLSPEAFAGEQLEAMAEKLSDGSLTPFVMHLVNGRGGSRDGNDRSCGSCWATEAAPPSRQVH